MIIYNNSLSASLIRNSLIMGSMFVLFISKIPFAKTASRAVIFSGIFFQIVGELYGSRLGFAATPKVIPRKY